MKKDKFVKMKVWFDEATYKEDLADADRKIKLLEEVLSQVVEAKMELQKDFLLHIYVCKKIKSFISEIT